MSTEKIMEQAQVFASAWSVVGGPFDDGDAMEVAAQDKAELKRMVGVLAAERDALAAKLAELEGQYPVFAFRRRGLPDFCTCTEGRYAELAEKPHLFEVRKLYARPVPAEMSPDFTDTARSALLWVLWHHQGGSSPVGQPIRYALGMDAHEHLSKHQVQEAKRWAALTKSESNDFRQARTAPTEFVNARLLEALKGLMALSDHRVDLRDQAKAARSAITSAEAQQERLLQDMHDAGREIDRVMAEPQPDADGWINPNDKTRKQYLPHIGERVLFCHAGITYYGKHTGGSFQSFNPPRTFGTWDCLWMYPPKAREAQP